MKRAFAIGCWLPRRWHERQALACVRSIRLAGHTEDILILTLDKTLRDRIGEYDWEVRVFPEIEYPMRSVCLDSPKKINWNRSDAQKMYFWKLRIR